MDTLDSVRKVAKAPRIHENPNGFPYSWIAPVIQVSPDEVVFVGEDDAVWMYQISQSRMMPTGIRNALPEFWRSQTKQLVCYNWESKEFFQVDLKSKHSEKIPHFKRSYFGFVYIPKHDAVVFGTSRLYFLVSERFEIFAYSFSSGEKVKLLSRNSISRGIWLN
jgi:hypothetical protein